MPTQYSFRLYDMEGLLLEPGTKRKENHPKTVSLSELRSFYLSIEHDQLLTQQCVLYDKVSSLAV